MTRIRRRKPERVLDEVRRLVRKPARRTAGGTFTKETSRSRRRLLERYVEHWDRLVTFGLSRGLSREEAEDRAQEVFMRITPARAGVGRAYLVRAIANEVRKYHRDRKVRHEAEAPLDAPYLVREVPDPQTTWEGTEARWLLDQVVAGLPEPGRTVFRLCCQVKWSAAKVARLLGKTTKAVERVRERAQQLLRQRLTRAVRSSRHRRRQTSGSRHAGRRPPRGGSPSARAP